ncbi:DNA polymerase III delta prime subunit [Volucribacter psittacicida]|uniref:DNA polymerase III subunit delta' n=1 Tax=Volucribacter psittacicida TaxID=203482 RepID=A0A4R1FXL7_9PAST|nr:DNA polymerase III subunit delta' [Volucribacter psittacicida]TCJ98532.1 DNA polymerase III delta prime subunit [Volucribacter psittacicida]
MNNLYPWLEPYYQEISQAFQQGYGHHALLFKAEPDIGVAALIHHLSAWLICQQQPKPCLACHACQLFKAGNHPDYYHISPIENKDISIEQIRELSEKLNQHAQQNGNKVVYLQDAHRLTEAAANALLKTLEEPRPQTYFLLQTDLSSPLLATIYSRCQTWLIHNPSEQQASHWLQQQLQNHNEYDLTSLQMALRITHNRPLAALTCLQQNWLQERNELIRQFWRFYQRDDMLQILPYFKTELIFQQLDWLIAFLMDSLKAKLNIQHHWACPDFQRAILQFAQQNNLQTLLNANQILQKVRSDLKNINGVNQELMLIDGLSGLLLEKENIVVPL